MIWISSQTIYPKAELVGSDTIVLVTPSQLKLANLIFLEHKKLKLERVQLVNQITNYEGLLINMQQRDSLRLQHINRLELTNEISNKIIGKQNKELTRKSRTVKMWRAVGIGGVVVGILISVFKK